MQYREYHRPKPRTTTAKSVLLLACATSLGTWCFSGPAAGFSNLLVVCLFLVWLANGADNTNFLRRNPVRGRASTFPTTGPDGHTVFARLVDEGKSPPRLWPDDRPVVAWSVDVPDLEAGTFDTISSTAHLLLEASDGQRFMLHPGCEWSAITMQQSLIENPPAAEDRDRVRAACLNDLAAFPVPSRRTTEDALGEQLDMLLRGTKRRRCSVFYAGQWVALTGVFTGPPTGYRGESTPTFAWRSGKIDDLSLDERWHKFERLTDIGPPIVALAIAIGMFGIAAYF
jgi:hypothetical protein